MGIAFFFIIGLCFGSFINALVWRIHESRDWVRDRSECPHCAHKLATKDLIPVISWFFLRGKCRYCQQNISKQYPVIELLTAFWFVASFHYWPAGLSGSIGQEVLLGSWLVASIGLIALLIYDHRYMILPNKIIYPSLIVASAGRAFYIFGYTTNIGHQLASWALSVVVASGIFFVLHEISKGQWIGFGDVRLGLLTGTLLASPSKSLLMIFLASLLGTVFALPKAFVKKKVLNTRFAYGPFLIAGCFTGVLFGQKIINWYLNSF